MENYIQSLNEWLDSTIYETTSIKKSFEKGIDLWKNGTKLHGSKKIKAFNDARGIIIDAILHEIGNEDDPSKKWDIIEKFKGKEYAMGNPMIINLLNSYQETLRHSIKIRNY